MTTFPILRSRFFRQFSGISRKGHGQTSSARSECLEIRLAGSSVLVEYKGGDYRAKQVVQSSEQVMTKSSEGVSTIHS